MKTPLILNIPHSSTYLPYDAVPKPEIITKSLSSIIQFGGGKSYIFGKVINSYREELLYMTDWYTEELFSNGIGRALVFPVSRLVCDVERFKNPDEEPMEKIGMGVCYSKRHDLKHLANPDNIHRQYILENYYDVYHRMLTCYVEEALREHEKVLIMDCHSFSPVPLPYEPDQNPDRPDICIGTDSFHTPQGLIDLAMDFFQSRGYSVSINSPYGGTIVPLKYLNKADSVHSIMLEINRGLYLVPESMGRADNFQMIKQLVSDYEEAASSWILKQ